MRVQNQPTARLLTAAALAAAGLLLALLAPGRAVAAHTPGSARDLKTAPPAGASVSDPGSMMTLDEGTTQLPATGNTQLPDTPDTPRPHHDRPPAHLP
jgi:hypothetical protein